jgi:anti-sigma regulatory factor (Ser/Thr protein kinase)
VASAVAVDEAATNIIQHAYAEVDTGVIKLQWLIEAGELQITLVDNWAPI